MIDDQDCCQRSELEAMLALNGVIQYLDGRKSLDVETENVATARRIYTLLKSQFELHPEVLVRKKMRLKKNNVYAVRVVQHFDRVLQGLGWKEWPEAGDIGPSDITKRKSCCRRSYLRGAFLAAGSVNDPGSSSYHLEVGANCQELARRLRDLMNGYGLHAKLIRRKKGYVVYLKEGEKIVEFLNIIGAHQALLKFEDVRILKGMRNQVNRLVNCETANLNKTIGAAVRQLEVIQLIDKHLGIANLPAKLREVAELRIKYPEVNLQELTMHLQQKVSKSGLNHRFRKLEEIAEKFRDG